MGWFFMLAADVGRDRDEAEAFALHFDGRHRRLSDGFTSEIATLPLDGALGRTSEDGPWWCRVVPSGMGTSGILPENERRADELGVWLYDLLREAPDFRIALVGVEVEEFCSVDSLGSPEASVPGIVVSQEVWVQMGMPEMESFRRGYLWIPPRVHRPA